MGDRKCPGPYRRGQDSAGRANYRPEYLDNGITRFPLQIWLDATGPEAVVDGPSGDHADGNLDGVLLLQQGRGRH
jgi:hypothetical protein